MRYTQMYNGTLAGSSRCGLMFEHEGGVVGTDQWCMGRGWRRKGWGRYGACLLQGLGIEMGIETT